MATGYIMVDTPNPSTPQGTYPRRGGAKLSGTCIVHTSEGNWASGVAPLTNLVRSRADYGCYHRACDWQDIALYYPWEWECWQDSETNNWAVGIAAACRTSDWVIMPDDVREGFYRNMARMAADFVLYMRTKGIEVPRVRITGAQARARVPGFCAHGDSGISRTDPGAKFEWDRFFRYINEALNGIEEDMPITDADATKVAKAVVALKFEKQGGPVGQIGLDGFLAWYDANMVATNKNIAAANAQIANLIGAVAALSKGEAFDEAKLLAGVQAAAEAGVKDAIASIETTVTLSTDPKAV
jgi:hypothetical protein